MFSVYFLFFRNHPFSLLALSSIVGDACFLGYAFDTYGHVSFSKLIGALSALFAHSLLLAYGDNQLNKIMHEKGIVSNIILMLRTQAKLISSCLPKNIDKLIRAKPVGIPCAILSLNGLGLLIDATLENRLKGRLPMGIQSLTGILIILCTSAYAAADFVNSQKVSNVLIKIAPTFGALITVSSFSLVIATWNPFLIIAVVAFSISNLAGFYTRIDKRSLV